MHKSELARLRGFEIDHEPDGWPGIRMREVSALCDEVERLQSAMRQCLQMLLTEPNTNAALLEAENILRHALAHSEEL